MKSHTPSPPLVSVIIPVYNGSRYVADCIKSILAQTMQDWEAIVIDDCSTDDSWDIISSFDDSRIKRFRNETNMGVSKTRNRGIREAKGDFIAFIDYDDLACVSRLKHQLEYLKKHPQLFGVGALAKLINEEGGLLGSIVGLALKSKEVPVRLLFENNFVLSSMLFKRKVFQEDFFDHDFEPAEDYELLTRIVTRFPVGNMDQILTSYRRHGSSVSRTKEKEMDVAVKSIIKRQLESINVIASEEDLEVHKSIAIRYSKSVDELVRIQLWLKHLKKTNREEGTYCNSLFEDVLSMYWFNCCMDAFSEKNIWRIYWRSSLSSSMLRTPGRAFKLFYRILPCLISRK